MSDADSASHERVSDAIRERLRRIELAATAALGVAGAATAAVFLYRALAAPSANDFSDFLDAGAHVLEHGRRADDSILSRYPPSMDAAWSLIARLPATAAACAYAAAMLATFAALARLLRREFVPAIAPEFRRLVVVSALAVGGVGIVAHLAIGAFHIVMVYCMTAGLLAALRGSALRGGVILGVAIWIKLLPLIGVGYLLLKRRFLAASIALLTALAIDVGLCLTAFGPSGTMDAHRAWLAHGTQLDLPILLSATADGHALSAKNQSLAAVVRRLLAPPPDGADRRFVRDVAMFRSPPGAIRVVYVVAVGLILLALAAYCRRRAAATSSLRAVAEIALIVLATHWLSPVAWTYHAVAVLPALAVLLGSRWERSGLRSAALLVWIAASAALASTLLASAGVTFWASALLAVAVAAWDSADPAAAPVESCRAESRGSG